MLRKIRKLILHPNRYFHDYFRKKLGFRKYFVTDKIRLLDAGNHQKWHKVLFSHPYLYLYYKFNKRLHKPAYPILVDYRIESIEKSGMGGGDRRVVLTVELERQNIIHFADPEIVLKALSGKEPYLAGKIFKFIFQGNDNQVFISGGVKFGRNIKINFIGDNNQLHIDAECQMIGGNINFHGSSNNFSLGKSCSILPNVKVEIKGNENFLELKDNCTFNSGFKIIFAKDRNYLYAGPMSRFTATSLLQFINSNGLIFLCGNQTINQLDARVANDCIILIGERSSNTEDNHYWVGGRKNLLIGSDVMMSRFLYLRTMDGHFIYDKNNKKRINKPKSIIIGDHVWIGQSCTFLKGANVEDGCVIGTKSIVNKHIPKNCIAAGTPAKPVKHEILWDRSADWVLDSLKLEEYDAYKRPEYTYKPIGYDKLVKIDAIDSGLSAKEKVKLIQLIINEV